VSGWVRERESEKEEERADCRQAESRRVRVQVDRRALRARSEDVGD